MKDVTVGPHGVYVSATATVAQLRTTFKVSQNLYSYKGQTLRANTEEPSDSRRAGREDPLRRRSRRHRR